MAYISNRVKQHKKSIKDYVLPIIGVAFILILFISVLSGDKKTTNQFTDFNTVKISLASQNTEAYVVGENGTKEKIDSNTKTLNPGEKIQVKDGTVNLDLEGKWKIKLSKLGELKLNKDYSLSLKSSDMWGEFSSGTKVDLNYMSLDVPAGTVADFSQNEVSSRVYVFKGFVTVKNLSGNTINIRAGNTLSLMMDESNNPSIDLKSKQEVIPDYIKTDDWFISNNVSYFLDNINKNKEDLSNSGNTISTGTTNSTNQDNSQNSSNNDSSYINIDFPKDEYVSNTDIIDIKGTIIDQNITKITFDYSKATINNGEFFVKGFELKNKTNDIVYRLYDKDDNLIKKGLITVYYTNAKESDKKTSKNKFGTVENYSLNPSEFKFISPKENPYTTSEDVVLIEGIVPAKTVSKIIVNGFKLSKFIPNGTYWKYYANTATENLKEGLNLYKVEYYDANGKLITSNVFTIIKKPKETSSTNGTGNLSSNNSTGTGNINQNSTGTGDLNGNTN